MKLVDNINSNSRPGFHNKELIIAHLRADGKVPVDKQTLVMFTNNGIIIVLILKVFLFKMDQTNMLFVFLN